MLIMNWTFLTLLGGTLVYATGGTVYKKAKQLIYNTTKNIIQYNHTIIQSYNTKNIISKTKACPPPHDVCAKSFVFYKGQLLRQTF